jgi:hypothetical protein
MSLSVSYCLADGAGPGRRMSAIYKLCDVITVRFFRAALLQSVASFFFFWDDGSSIAGLLSSLCSSCWFVTYIITVRKVPS